LTIEPHLGSILEDPRDVLTVVRGAEGLRLTLDFSHFLCLGFSQADIDPLIEYSAHMHIRQCKPGSLQTPVDDGVLSIPLLLDKLREAEYRGYLSVEYLHQGFMQADRVDVVTETVRMKRLLELHI